MLNLLMIIGILLGVVKVVQKEPKNINVYLVYIIINPAWEGWIKVGMALDAQDRLKSYQTSSPLRDYKLKYKKYFKDRKKAEHTAHDLLDKESLDRNGEWFKITQIKARGIIESI